MMNGLLVECHGNSYLLSFPHSKVHLKCEIPEVPESMIRFAMFIVFDIK